MPDEHFLNLMASQLRERLTQLDKLEEQNARDRAPVELDQTRVGRLSRMDALQGQAMAEAQGERRRLECLRIESALSRMADGIYGECLRCGDDIASARLQADPATPVCVLCAGNG